MTIDIWKYFVVICLMIAVGFFWPKIPAPWSWVIAALACVLALIVLVVTLGGIQVR